MKKKIIAILTVAVCIFAFAACGESDESAQTDESTQATEETAEASDEASEEMQHTLVINSEPFCVTPDTCDDRGYNYMICDSDGTYTFKAVNNDGKDITWSVYLMDKKFDDATRYISESMDPSLEGDGELDINEGQYIYVYCSENSFTSDDSSELKNSWLEINYK